ncbi:MAG: NosD domain-containing protein, partial [Promethearchaeota archaeon]
YDNITIISDADFHAQAKDNWDVQGSHTGNITHPYIIEGLNITDPLNHQIEIQNTTVFFQIRNCFLKGEENVDSLQQGISLINVTNANISSNIISYNLDGISLSNSVENVISNNIIANNSHNGVIMTADSDFNVFINNTVFNNWWNGICLYSHNNTLSKNDIYMNGAGIDVYSGLDNEITENVFRENSGYGIAFSLSGRFNTVTRNDFVRNNERYGPQANDNGIFSVPNPIACNIIEYNFWDEWTSPDEVAPSGIVDEPYIIIGSVANTDPYPVTTPYNSDLHTLSQPLIVPFGDENLSGTVTISWVTSDSFRSHTVEYSIFYSDDSGTTWTLIDSGVTNTNYQWDTTTLANGEYLIKIIATCSDGLTTEGVIAEIFTIYNDIKETSTITTTATKETTSTKISDKTTPGFTALCLLSIFILYISRFRETRQKK